MRIFASVYLGWTPILAVATDGARKVLEVTGWTGGSGTAPATGVYVGPTGYVSNIIDGVDISGGVGSIVWGDITGTLSNQTDLQTALDAKAPIASPTFTGIVSGITKSMVGLGNVDNTSDATKNSAIATLTNKTLTSPVINTPTGIVKGDVGLGNVDNTSDANKPISTATQTALDGKVDENTSIIGATKTKITYDAKGLVTSGADATTADIADSTNKRYVTDANLTVINNTSNVNTGDQDLTPYFNKSVDDTDDITEGAINKFATASEKTKVGFISVTQSVDLDTIESDTIANNAKVTNATHTGEMTGATVLSADKTIITNKAHVAAAVGDSLLISDLSDSGNLKETTIQDILNLVPAGPTYITGTAVIDFGNENDCAVTTVSNASITNTGLKSCSFVPQDTTATSLDDFSLNGVSFSIENIVDNTSFDVRGTAVNNASNNYTIKYLIQI